MIVLEMPSLTDDFEGVIAGDNSGSFLKNTLAQYGIKDYYITFAVKCRVTEKLTKDHIKNCAPYLEEEIRTVKPDLIFTFGNIALNSVTGRSGISSYRGKELVSKGGIPVIATYSPGSVLRIPKYTHEFNTDMQKVANFMAGRKSHQLQYVIHYVTTKEVLTGMIRHLKDAVKNDKNIYGALDLETTTFDYWRPETSVMTMALTVDGYNLWTIPMVHPQSPWRNQTQTIVNLIKPFFESIKWVGNNWKYDVKWMRKKYNTNVNFGPDNMLMSYILDENIPHGLKYQAAVNFDAPDYDKDIHWPKKYDPVYDDIIEVVKQFHRMDLGRMMKYNALDALYSWHNYPVYKDMLLQKPRLARIYKHLLEKGSKVFTLIEEEGMWIDPDKIAQAKIQCDEEIEKSLKLLNSLIPKGWAENNLNKKQLKTGFNWNSPQQLGKLLFQDDGLGFPIIQLTDSGKPSTAEAVLLELHAEFDHPMMDGIMEYRKWAKYRSTYLEPWSHKVDDNNMIHPTFKLHGTVTGRLSGEDGAHQVPRDDFIRGLIGAPPGWSFFEIDGSQIELRVVAIVANERKMLSIFAMGGDIHTATAAAITGKLPEDVTYDERKKAKAVNFGFVYGMGWKKFKQYAWEKYGVRLTDKEAKDYRRRFFELYPDLGPWHFKMKKLVKMMGYVVSPIGRERHLPNIYSSDDGMRSAAEREAINSPVQGFGSDYVLAGFIEMVLDHILPEDPKLETIKPVGSVHDAQYYMIRNDKLDYWPHKLKEVFDDPSRLLKWFGYTPTIPITGDCKIGTHWGSAKDWLPGEEFPFTPR
jgi:DNA polymerase-1